PIMKFVNTKAVKAIQDGMVYSLPFIIIGSIFLIMSNFPIPAVSQALSDSGWSAFFSQAYTASFGMISVWSVVGIAYVYVKNEKVEPLPAALTALSAFLLLQFMQVDSPLKAAEASGISNAAGKVVLSGSAVAQN
ncbi:PTS transporter subunit EIIC, partial [Lactobacillus nasalidis]